MAKTRQAASAQTPAPDMPSEHGSYVRQSDGSLVRADFTQAAPEPGAEAADEAGAADQGGEA